MKIETAFTKCPHSYIMTIILMHFNRRIFNMINSIETFYNYFPWELNTTGYFGVKCHLTWFSFLLLPNLFSQQRTTTY